MISLTQSAQNRIKQQLNNRGRGLGIRLGVKTTGCSGLAYILEYVDEPNRSDTVINQDSFNVYIDSTSLVYLEGLTVDYVKKGLNEGFDFVNPNERDRCGCGSSFRV